ncbi:mitochondrion biogenesis protein (She9), putative [Talaromyces stipitatus ATCC 10500]|uniref:Sensitive to high expression protein 9, mitochondrial n=1 Tax=Talaromyces stipitatus (strain ATCC 10500 / CBS 375.48 / QM 6759 / NRRL 1006) TaxID=441959 RepID=B8LSV3_TALSN|nr:mitochondrion biogenesis protein (She9), putative [Talaromyces stipitatus ATCC 10500]EED22949.1 mitochondrion biogenesis protein (She9), putative [Talaromyces stipitatus ATCC 10500]
MQLLLRQPLRNGLSLIRPSCQRLFVTSLPPKQLSLSAQSPAAQTGSLCLRCQFRTQSRRFSSKQENEKPRPELQNLQSTPDAGKDFASVTVNNEGQQDIESVRLEQKQAPSTPGEDNLPSDAERRRSQLSKKFTDLMDNIQGNVFIAGQKLNDLTGYSGIEKLKRDIENQENQVLQGRSLVRHAKEAYSAAINRRSASQREVNELLQRKHAWSATDLERFTSLYRSDHANEVAEHEAQEALTKAEHELEEATAGLNRSILSRYHEEQIWSDKIRRMSTWGTWGLMGVNVLLFLIFQILVEPWRRRRLVKGFEEKVKEAIETEAEASRTIVAGLTRAVEAGAATAAETPTAPEPVAEMAASEIILQDGIPEVEPQGAVVVAPGEVAPVDVVLEEDVKDGVSAKQLSTYLSTEYWRQTFQDVLSDRHVGLTQRELTKIALQSATIGAAVGATIIGLTVTFLRPN